MKSRDSHELFEHYREDQGMGPQARERALRQLHARIARGELAPPEANVSPPALPRVRAWQTGPLGWGGAAIGLALLAVFGAKLTTDPSSAEAPAASSQPLTAAETAGRREQPPETPRVGASAEVAVRELGQPASSAPLSAAAPRRRAAKPAPPQTALAQPLARSVADASAQPPSELRPTPQEHTRGSSDTAPEPQRAQSTAPERAAEAQNAGTLLKELQLLQAAQLALRDGDARRALSLLAEHTWTYPRGQLAEARDVARILALCRAGDEAQSERDAKRFLQQYPRSPYAMRVRAGCAVSISRPSP